MRPALSLAAALLAIVAVPAAAQFSDGYTFLKAVRDADGAKVTTLINKPGSIIIDTRDPATGESALHIVTKRRDITWLAFLLGRGAKPDVRTSDGTTPLLLATQLGWTDGMSLLLDRRATVDLGNNAGETPLIRAVQLRDLTTVKLLLSKGADPKRADRSSGLSARDYATRDPRAGLILRELDAAKPKKAAVMGPN